ncbi:Matrixin [uncultured archaeon]|nr:Matrixin [uncultured archaeon]
MPYRLLSLTQAINTSMSTIVDRGLIAKMPIVISMVDKFSASIIMFALLMGAFSTPAFGISVGFASGGGSGSVSASGSYHLDTSTALQSSSVLSGGEMQQSQQVSGTGLNALDQRIKGDRYSIGSSISSSGALSATSSSEASSASGSLSQQLSGAGDASMAVGGVQGEDKSDQRSSVTYGGIASLQSVSAGKGISSSQRTDISGEAGSLGSGALSSSSMMLVTGSFEGSGSLNAELNAGTADQASAHGKVSVNGGTLIDDSTIQSVGKDSVGLSMEGLTAAPEGGTGSFSASVVNINNINQANSKLAVSDSVAAAQAQTGYNLWTYNSIPMKWTTNNPQVQLYLVGSSVPGTLNQENVQSAISTAANTWDNVVGQNLFADGSTVKIDNTKKVVPADGTSTVGANTQGWRTLSSNENPSLNTLAITYNWFNGPSGGYYSITESDTAFNNAVSWSTTGGTYDVQTVSLHELGHTIGLGHISDTNQIMNPYYTGVRHTLGSGDMAGAQYLYSIGGNIALQAVNGKYVCAEDGGLSPLIANRDWSRSWETFGLTYIK